MSYFRPGYLLASANALGLETPVCAGLTASSIQKDTVMNKDQVKGRLEAAKGSIKETVGKAVGSTKLQGEGAVDKAAGKTEATYGDAKDKVKTAIKKR